MQLQGQLDTVLQGWRLVHKQPMPSGCHKVSPVRLTFLLFNGALWGWAQVGEDLGLLFCPLVHDFKGLNILQTYVDSCRRILVLFINLFWRRLEGHFPHMCS